MKITAVKGIPLSCACSPIGDALSTSTFRQALLVIVETDSSCYGIGESFTFGAPLAVMKHIVEMQLAPMIIGQDPSQIEMLWNTMYWRTIAHGRRSLVMGAISGIDIALWDLLGKMSHMPVCKLLGACSHKVPTYASGGFYGPDKGIDGLRAEMEGYIKKGYRNAKLKIGRNPDRPGSPLRYMANREWGVTEEEDIKRMEAVREILGIGRMIVDANASWDSGTALQMGRELGRLGVSWLEEPVPFEDLEGLGRISRELPHILIAGCETQQGLKNFETMVRLDAVDVLQPDIGWAGGFTECRKIGAMGEAAGRNISLHCFGSAVLFCASLHLAASMANTEMMESEENPNPLKSDLAEEPFEADGQMDFYVPQGDGLGIALDWTKVEKYTIMV